MHLNKSFVNMSSHPQSYLLDSASRGKQHLKVAMLAESVDEDRQQAGVQLLDIFQDDYPLRAALQEAGQQLLHTSRRICVPMTRLPGLQNMDPDIATPTWHYERAMKLAPNNQCAILRIT